MVYIDISRFSEPKEAAIDKVGLTLTGCWWKCYNAGFEGEKSTDISEFPSPSVKTEQHFYQRSVKVGGGYGKIQSVTVCGKQENMNRFTLVERIGIECGIYQKLKLSEIAKKIGKTPGSVSREIRANRTVTPGEHPCGKDCCFAGHKVRIRTKQNRYFIRSAAFGACRLLSAWKIRGFGRACPVYRTVDYVYWICGP